MHRRAFSCWPCACMFASVGAAAALNLWDRGWSWSRSRGKNSWKARFKAGGRILACKVCCVSPSVSHDSSWYRVLSTGCSSRSVPGIVLSPAFALLKPSVRLYLESPAQPASVCASVSAADFVYNFLRALNQNTELCCVPYLLLLVTWPKNKRLNPIKRA